MTIPMWTRCAMPDRSSWATTHPNRLETMLPDRTTCCPPPALPVFAAVSVLPTSSRSSPSRSSPVTVCAKSHRRSQRSLTSRDCGRTPSRYGWGAAVLSAGRAVLQMQEYHPPLAARQGLRLDFNENTEGCSPRVLERIRHISAEELARYPEREPLETLVSDHLQLA